MNAKRFSTLKTILILFITCLFLNGCISINTSDNIAPDVRFSSETNILTWSPIKSAYKYQICVDEQTILESNVTNYDLSKIPYGEHVVKVRAVNLLGTPISEYSYTIYVKVERPLSEVLELLSTTYMSANVKIVAEKNYFNSTSVFDGSGIIFKKENYGNGYKYYCLTNNHVVVQDLRPNYFVVDHKATTHNASLVCYSDAYDLAVVTFTSSSIFEVLPFNNEDYRVDDKVVALGNPLGSLNNVTAGNVTSVDKIVNVKVNTGETDYSNVNFPVLAHTAKIDSGSSGGALISYDFKIVGINYATGIDLSNNEYVEAYAVPISKVKEFLTLNQITY